MELKETSGPFCRRNRSRHQLVEVDKFYCWMGKGKGLDYVSKHEDMSSSGIGLPVRPRSPNACISHPSPTADCCHKSRGKGDNGQTGKTVWTIFEVCFGDARFRLYSRLPQSPVPNTLPTTKRRQTQFHVYFCRSPRTKSVHVGESAGISSVRTNRPNSRDAEEVGDWRQ